MRFVHAHPELGHGEYQCSEYLASVLRESGYSIEHGIARMPTAFTATLDGAEAGRSVGVVLLYDAVAAVRENGTIEPVHSCGHGPISGGIVMAARAIASLRSDFHGSLVVVGCPADEIHTPGTREIGGGKALSAEAGVWDELDAALYPHPEFLNTVTLESKWMSRQQVRVYSARSLEPGTAQPPLDAASALVGVAQLLPRDSVVLERLELDGDVEEGTGLVCSSTVLVVANDEQELEELAGRARASLPDAEWTEGITVCGVLPDALVIAAVKNAFLAAGLDFVDDPPPLPFATDFGNISRRVPSALIGIGREQGWSFHTDEGVRQFASGAGEEAMVSVAKVVALSVSRLTSETP